MIIYLLPRATANYQRCFTVLPDSSNCEEHLLRTLVTTSCSALCLLTNLVSSIAFSNQNVL